MNTIIEKVLDSSRLVGIDLKRKHSDRGSVCCTGDRKVLFPLRSPPGLCIHNIGKRRRLDASRAGAFPAGAFPAGKRLLTYYSNFKKSESLQRLMYYENDEWNDFSEAIVTLVNKDMLVKKPAVEVEVDGSRILLDFLHMMQLDMETGMHQPIAWIDVSGNCFFPEIVGTSDEQSFHCQFVEGCDQMGVEPQNINLHLEIEIHGLDNESSGESMAVGEQVEAHSNIAPEGCDDEINNSFSKAIPLGGDKKCAQSRRMEENMILAADRVPLFLDFDAVKDMFFKAIKLDGAAIVEIQHCSSTVMESRFELFEKQFEITKKYRKDANLVYAWLPCPKGTASTVINFGIGHYELRKNKPLNGIGLYLIPANGTPFSINNFDVDENGARHVVLCHVIMGNMEVVPYGSEQFHPSCQDFDSGVDNLQTPSRYVVWNMNMNSHIYPECIVSFNVASVTEGPINGQGNRIGVYGVAPGPETLEVQRRTPKGPYMAFPVLFASISDKVPPQNMEHVRILYELFKSKTVSRDVFISKLRWIVGDAVLKSAITSLKREISESSASVVETS